MGCSMRFESLARFRESLISDACGADGCDLLSPEVLREIALGAASLTAPCERNVLRGEIVRVLQYLEDSEKIRSAVDEAIEALLAYGDLIERAADDWDGTEQIWVALPSFVLSDAGHAFLLGAQPDGQSLLPEDLQTRVIQRSYSRIIEPIGDEDLAVSLAGAGLSQIQRGLWFDSPWGRSAAALIERRRRQLEKCEVGGEVEGLQVLDPNTRVTYYKGRWRDVSAEDNGFFVSRRPQRYGADLWCYARIEAGASVRLLDFPVGVWRGCDDAWHLQLAIDFERGNSQVYRVRSTSLTDSVVVDFFSPIPSWARRRLALIGSEAEPDHCLFSYSLPRHYWQDQRQETLEESLWLRDADSRTNSC
jgi:hypothetical protein